MGWRNLLILEDDSISGCSSDAPPNSPVTADQVRDVRLSPAQSGQPAKVVISARFARGLNIPAHRAKCAELERSDRPVNVAASFRVVSRELVLVWDGQTLTPDAPTKATLKEFGVESEPPN